jgi:hypothetical protein
LLAAWLLTQDAAKRNVVERIATATQQGNIHALNSIIDWGQRTQKPEKRYSRTPPRPRHRPADPAGSGG